MRMFSHSRMSAGGEFQVDGAATNSVDVLAELRFVDRMCLS